MCSVVAKPAMLRLLPAMPLHAHAINDQAEVGGGMSQNHCTTQRQSRRYGCCSYRAVDCIMSRQRWQVKICQHVSKVSRIFGRTCKPWLCEPPHEWITDESHSCFSLPTCSVDLSGQPGRPLCGVQPSAPSNKMTQAGAATRLRVKARAHWDQDRRRASSCNRSAGVH